MGNGFEGGGGGEGGKVEGRGESAGAGGEREKMVRLVP